MNLVCHLREHLGLGFDSQNTVLNPTWKVSTFSGKWICDSSRLFFVSVQLPSFWAHLHLLSGAWIPFLIFLLEKGEHKQCLWKNDNQER